MNSSSKYLEQFNRVKRWYQQFVLIDQGRPHDRPSDFYQDQVYAFFQNCYHLKDWIIKDTSVGPTKKDVEDFINCHRELKLCADICNSSKHLVLDRLPRSNEDPQFGQRKFKVAVGSGATTISVEYIIDASEGPYDAFKLATKCLELWEKFIREQVQSKTGTK